MNEFEPNGLHPNAPGAKLDGGKMRAGLMVGDFAHALRAVASVTTFGAAKYTPRGWQSVPNADERYMDAAMRHILADLAGEAIDADSQQLHIAQAAWNLLAVLELRLRESVS